MELFAPGLGQNWIGHDTIFSKANKHISVGVLCILTEQLVVTIIGTLTVTSGKVGLSQAKRQSTWFMPFYNHKISRSAVNLFRSEGADPPTK